MDFLKRLVALMLVFSAVQAEATTAILCGNPDEVDQNESSAIIHLIFDNFDFNNPEDFRLYSKGNRLAIESVEKKFNMALITLKESKGLFNINLKNIIPTACENFSENTFQIEHFVGNQKKIIDECRCFQD